MRNWIYHTLLVPFAASKKNRVKHIRSKLRLAAMVGGPDVVILGDSNAETLDTRAKMLKFKGLGVVVNIAIGGTRADDWILMMMDKIDIYGKIKLCRIFMNIGGNHLWVAETMMSVQQHLKVLRNLFPQSWNMTIPPIHHEILEDMSEQPGAIEPRLMEVNNYIKEIWGPKTIDIYPVFKNWKGTGAYLYVLKDLVHFSNEADFKVRIPLIKGALKL